MRQENPRALVVHEEFLYQQEAHRVVGWVLSEYGEQEAISQGVEDRRAFAQRRLPVYIDALKRGREVILRQLDRGDLKYEVANGLGWKQFNRGLDSVYWTIYSKSEDPFDRVRLQRELELDGIHSFHGRVEIFTEPVLVGMMLEQGLKEQEQKYETFKKVCQKVTNVEQTARETLVYLVSPQDFFRTISEVDRHLQAVPDEFLRKELFVKRYLIPNQRILHDLSLIEDMVTQVSRLQGLFTHYGRLVTSTQRIKYQNSLVCNLMVDPKIVKDMISFRQPETTLTSLQHFNRLVQMLDQDPMEKAKQKWLLAHWASELAKPELPPYFSRLGIREDVGFEYIFHLLLKILDQQLTADLVNLSNEERRETSQNEGLMTGVRNEPPFVKEFFLRSRFPNEIFRDLSLDRKLSGLRALLRYNQTLDSGTAQQKLAMLIDFFGLQFNPQKGIFEVPAHLLKSRASILRPDIIRMLLGLFAEQLEAGDINLFPFLANLTIKASLPAFLQARHLPVNQTQFELEFFDVVRAKRTRQEKTLEWRIAKLVEVTAGYFASLYYVSEHRDIEAVIAEKLNWVIMNAQERDYDAPEAFRVGGTIPVTHLLVGQRAVEFRNQVLVRMDELILACKQEIFAPGQEPTRQKLQEILEKSIG